MSVTIWKEKLHSSHSQVPFASAQESGVVTRLQPLRNKKKGWMAGAGLCCSLSVSVQSRATASFMARLPVPLLKQRHNFRLKFQIFSDVRVAAASSSSSTRLLSCGCSLAEDRVAVDMGNYKEAFARRMAMAGLKPHHSIALGVSGGPDSMALCFLTAAWKIDGPNAAGQSCGYIDGLLAIIVDHGLRAESKEEARIVSHRVSKMGIRCEIADCNWSDGRPKQGHLQEAAREMRYQMFQKVCIQHQIDVLLIAHHADDQAELLILRLSRSSGVLGLAGMAFNSQLFSSSTVLHNQGLNNKGTLVVRPLLHFSKEDMYKICQAGNQEWVEDPTNQNPLYARNRIRIALAKLSSYSFQSELQAIISSCRKTRAYVDHVSNNLIDQAVTIMDKFLIYVFQRPLPWYCSLSLNGTDLLEVPLQNCYWITFVLSHTSFTASGCYLCPSPGSRGTKILVCCSVVCPRPSKPEVMNMDFSREQKQYFPQWVDEIIAEGKSYVDQFVPDVLDVKFMDATCQSVLTEAKRLGIISESTYIDTITLQRDETKNFKPDSENKINLEQESTTNSSTASASVLFQPGQACYFMNRFLITWSKLPEQDRQFSHCYSLEVDHQTTAEIRPMTESDWLYLAKLGKSERSNDLQLQITDSGSEKSDSYLAYLQLSAQKSLQSLKSIPLAARRSLPVLVNRQGLLLSIPSIGYRCCPCLMVDCAFKPRVPLGGGHSSYL
ncbi:tRNA(Ile)-lysidine synthase [Linum perenne]